MKVYEVTAEGGWVGCNLDVSTRAFLLVEAQNEAEARTKAEAELHGQGPGAFVHVGSGETLEWDVKTCRAADEATAADFRAEEETWSSTTD